VTGGPQGSGTCESPRHHELFPFPRLSQALIGESAAVGEELVCVLFSIARRRREIRRGR